MKLFLIYFCSLDPDQLAMIMLCEDEENFDLFEDTEEQLLFDEDILMLLLKDCSNRKEPDT